ncbi:MAG: thioredoxin family protein [Deltaproteobacteria bacterium]|nr:MAG: thioredoxin family protein [Deltaproteobacteria bacterium]
MVMTPSQDLPLGTPAPPFSLPDPEGKLHGLDDAADAKGYVVIFMCNHCPFVKLIREKLAEVARTYQAKGIAFFGINSNDASKYPDDAPDKMAEEIEAFGYTFPYLVDETQEVAKAYRAACTPDIFVFDGARKLYYHGQFDDARPGNGKPVTGKDLTAALDRLLAGEPPPDRQIPSVGCNIKWKPGNEPDYFG